MGCIIISMPKLNDAKRLREIIKRSDIWEEVVLCSKGAETLRAVKKLDATVVISASRFSDMGYEELSAYLPNSVRMVLLTRDDNKELFSGNIVKLCMPFRGEQLITILHDLLAVPNSEKKKRIKRRSAHDQMIIDQAKELLMEKRDMSEPDAFRYLQKSSMDMGRSMVDTAQMILMIGS